jgi:hypothetical protein
MSACQGLELVLDEAIAFRGHLEELLPLLEELDLHMTAMSTTRLIQEISLQQKPFIEKRRTDEFADRMPDGLSVMFRRRNNAVNSMHR